MSWKTNLRKNGIIADYNRGSELDFGYGFYLTTTAELAERYISRLWGWQADRAPLQELVIMEYDMTPLVWFEDPQYNAIAFPAFDDVFAEFVFFNRTENANGSQQHNYDVIYGVMSDSVPTALLLQYRAGEITKEDVLAGLKKSNSMKQISLHSQQLCDIITLRRAYTYDPATDCRKELDMHD